MSGDSSPPEATHNKRLWSFKKIAMSIVALFLISPLSFHISWYRVYAEWVNWQIVSTLLISLIWPITCVCVCLLFKGPVSKLIDEIEEFNLPWGPAKRRSSVSSEDLGPSQDSANNVTADSGWKPGNTYWLAVDLTYTVNALNDGGDMRKVLRGLEQAGHHLSSLSLPDLEPELARIRRFEDDIKNNVIRDGKSRLSLADAVNSLIVDLGKKLSSMQPNYKRASD